MRHIAILIFGVLLLGCSKEDPPRKAPTARSVEIYGASLLTRLGFDLMDEGVVNVVDFDEHQRGVLKAGASLGEIPAELLVYADTPAKEIRLEEIAEVAPHYYIFLLARHPRLKPVDILGAQLAPMLAKAERHLSLIISLQPEPGKTELCSYVIRHFGWARLSQLPDSSPLIGAIARHLVAEPRDLGQFGIAGFSREQERRVVEVLAMYEPRVAIWAVQAHTGSLRTFAATAPVWGGYSQPAQPRSIAT
ncbi:MAG: hypothetical protein ACI8W8_005125 [Rhodothermales bacterium]|jgi:hypothetical protein